MYALDFEHISASSRARLRDRSRSCPRLLGEIDGNQTGTCTISRSSHKTLLIFLSGRAPARLSLNLPWTDPCDRALPPAKIRHSRPRLLVSTLKVNNSSPFSLLAARILLEVHEVLVLRSTRYLGTTFSIRPSTIYLRSCQF